MFWMTQTAQYALQGRAWLAAVLCLAALLAWPLEANAASRLCRQLESQLADAGRGGSGGSPSQLRRYNLAIKAQRDQLQKARRIQRRSNCGSYDSDRGRNSCSGMASQLSRMERNLRSLEARRDELASGGGNPRRERARILAALDANGCRDASGSDQPREQVARRDNRNFFDRLFGNERRDRRYEDEEAPPITERERVRSNIVVNPDDGYGGSHRTLCVRTCDGYYWPISYSSSRGDFVRDEQNCQTMCPGTEVRLFTHRVPEQESEEMVSLAGEPYANMSTAFKYREADFQRPADCSCRSAPKNYSVIAGNGAQQGGDAIPAARPQSRPDPAADAETEANRNGGLDQDVVRRLIESSPSADVSDRKVRVVGPAYLPDPPKAEARQVPVQTAIQ